MSYHLLVLPSLALLAGGGDGDIFQKVMGHVMPTKIGVDPVTGLNIYKGQVFQLLSVTLTFILFGMLRTRLARGESLSGPFRFLSGFVLWIRDEMVVPILGKEDGRRLLPYFLFIFFFIMFCNLMGLLPMPLGGTATASYFVTGALATTTLIAVIFLGSKQNGVLGFWKGLIPHGVPMFLVPVMFVIEVISLFARHFALMIRLWVAMTVGHLILGTFLGLIFVFGGQLGLGGGLGASVGFVGVSALVMIIESFVALLQAYIFTLLSIIFIGGALHPDH